MDNPKPAIERANANTEWRLPALAISRGIGIGQVVFLNGKKRRFTRLGISTAQIDGEVQRFRTALDESIRQIEKLTKSASNESIPEIFGVQLLILESSLPEKIETEIKAQFVNAEWAIRTVSDEFLERQASVADPYFRGKYLDIEDVTNRLLNALNGSSETIRTEAGAVVFASNLSPSAVMEIAKSNPAAVVTEHGGWTSHASILARELKLPMVSGLRNMEHFVSLNDTVIVDGGNGEIILNPTETTITKYGQMLTAKAFLAESFTDLSKGIVTKDGTAITIRANVDLPEAYAEANNNGTRGIGLFRSESLIGFSGSFPTEDEQTAAYCRIADAAGGECVKIRTFDIGISRVDRDSFSAERNPSLGLRSIRLSLSEQTHFRTQIRALLQASFDRNIDIVLPMVSGVSEVLRSKAIIDEESSELTKRGVDHGSPKLGAMIEIPSAVLTAREIAQNVDFLCLGTNDLVQYLLAVDRDNDAVADWYQTLHPAVIRAIGTVISAAVEFGIPVSVCGEMAGSPFYLPVLIGLGARELSMNVNSISLVKYLLSGITVSEAGSLVEMVRDLYTADEIESVLRKYYIENWSGLFPPGILNTRHR